jgi:D-3-phosphoglycerate dehydrogenase
VIYYDTIDKLQHGNVMPAESMDALLAESDVVTLHVPDTPGTRDMFGADQIAKMKKGAFLINNARGKVVDIDALAAALKSGHLAGAAVDVFPVEPKSNKDEFISPLRGLDNVILTPHVGGSTEEAQARIGEEVSKRLWNTQTLALRSAQCPSRRFSCQRARMRPASFRCTTMRPARCAH